MIVNSVQDWMVTLITVNGNSNEGSCWGMGLGN